jgi:hypothetical protein
MCEPGGESSDSTTVAVSSTVLMHRSGVLRTSSSITSRHRTSPYDRLVAVLMTPVLMLVTRAPRRARGEAAAATRGTLPGLAGA